MFRVGFEPTIAMFEWAKIFLALDRAATVMGNITELYEIRRK
jgi:hypothetical protein